MNRHKTILVAPLNWGLGHATRCIPIIRGLLDASFKVCLGSDGIALDLLRKEFPDLDYIELPSYNIRYPKKGRNFKARLLLKLPGINKTAKAERKLIRQLVSAGKIDGIVSDNRLGVYHKDVPAVFMTHQINVLSGSTSKISSRLHQKIIKRFDACFVPDVAGPINLSGKLGHPKKGSIQPQYLGLLSRMRKKDVPRQYQILAILSGPEPQRTILEAILEAELGKLDQKSLMVRGVVESQQSYSRIGNLEAVNFMTSRQLEEAINASELIVSRSGYTTLMDLAVMEKKAFFIPTPGQYEQIYLAKKLKEQGVAPYCKQKRFKAEKLKEIALYSGLGGFSPINDLEALVGFFEGE